MSSLNLPSSGTTIKRSLALPGLTWLVLLLCPLATSEAPDVRPGTASSNAIMYQGGLHVITSAMPNAKASQCQAPEACSALRKNATPVASDGALRLGSTQIIKNPMASLSKGLLVEKNYKGIGHVRHHWLVAVDPQCWLFGYEAGGKVVYVEPNDYGAWPTYAELPSEIAGSGESKNRQLVTVLKRGTMAMLFSPLGKTGTLQGVLGDSSPLPAGTPLTPCRPSCAPVLSFAGPRQLLPSPPCHLPSLPNHATPPHSNPP